MDHTQGFAEQWECGYEYYITYLGEYSSTIFIMDIANDGDEDLILSEIPAFTAESSSDFVVINPPTNLTIAPGSSAHFGILYDAPEVYNGATATLEIKSNDPDQGVCTVSFKVGANIPNPILYLREGTGIIPKGPDAIDFGTVEVGKEEIKHLNVWNPTNLPILVSTCRAVIVIIPPINYPEGPIMNINFKDGPYQIPGRMIPFPPIFMQEDYILGPDASEFSSTLPFPGFVVGPNSSHDFDLTFAPTEEGEKEAALCYHYIKNDNLFGGTENFGINAVAVLPQDLPGLPKSLLILMGIMVLSLGVFLVIRQVK